MILAKGHADKGIILQCGRIGKDKIDTCQDLPGSCFHALVKRFMTAGKTVTKISYKNM